VTPRVRSSTSKIVNPRYMKWSDLCYLSSLIMAQITSRSRDSGLRDSKSRVFHLQTYEPPKCEMVKSLPPVLFDQRPRSHCDLATSGLCDSKSRVFHLQTYETPICEMVRSLPPVLQHGRPRCLQDFWDVVEFTLSPK
jgi:hypothetical protein